MSRHLNLQLKDGVGPKELLKYGFLPKYDEDTGEIKEYYRKFVIDNFGERHFTFSLYPKSGGWFKWLKRFEYTAWMSGFNWGDVTTDECMKLLYDLIINGIVEPAER